MVPSDLRKEHRIARDMYILRQFLYYNESPKDLSSEIAMKEESISTVLGKIYENLKEKLNK